MIPARAVPGGVRLEIRVQPRASKTEFAGVHGESLKVRVAAPPVDGAANRELIRFLSATFKVSRGSVQLVSGESGRRKAVVLGGVTLGGVMERLAEKLD